MSAYYTLFHFFSFLECIKMYLLGARGRSLAVCLFGISMTKKWMDEWRDGGQPMNGSGLAGWSLRRLWTTTKITTGLSILAFFGGTLKKKVVWRGEQHLSKHSLSSFSSSIHDFFPFAFLLHKLCTVAAHFRPSSTQICTHATTCFPMHSTALLPSICHRKPACFECRLRARQHIEIDIGCFRYISLLICFIKNIVVLLLLYNQKTCLNHKHSFLPPHNHLPPANC